MYTNSRYSFIIALVFTLAALAPATSRAEGSAQLTPNNAGSTSPTNVTNTFVGYLQHNDGANSNSFLKPSTFAGFNEDHRLYIRIKDGETLYYGVRRIATTSSGNQADLILTLRYGSGSGTEVKRDTLTRDTTSTKHSTLLAQSGVIANHAEAVAGPRIGGLPAGGYDPLSFTNSTGADRDFYIEFTQVNESGLGAARKSHYDCWDFTVIDTSDVIQTGRMFSKQWSFSAAGSGNRLSATFNFYPLIPSIDDSTVYYVKQVELAGMRPWGFIFMCNSEGTTSGATKELKRQSQTTNTSYPEYKVFVNDPDTAIWPSATIKAVIVSATPYCNSLDQGNVLLTYQAFGPGEAGLVINLDTVPGYQTGGEDVWLGASFDSAGFYNLVWNGKDGNGTPVSEGEATSMFFTLEGGIVHFPLWDVERNADGFRVKDVRPDTVWSPLFWDDTNLPAAGFSPQTEFVGSPSEGGTHSWGATGNDGDNSLVNTWSYGSVVVDSFVLELKFQCDFDGDGIMNSVDIDDDNDGITDSLEHTGSLPYGDADGDSLANYLDVDFVHPLYGSFRDSNSDGINDLFDADGDGIPNFRDTDSDGDGFPDAAEANGGVKPAGFEDSTGRITGSVGANGLPDGIETSSESGISNYAMTDTDADGRPDFRDQDSDNDGLTDNIEFQASGSYRAPSGDDADGDGIDDEYDTNAGGSLVSPIDFDAIYPETDGIPDYQDEDSDGDGQPDWYEGFDDDYSGDALNDYVARAAAFESANGNPGWYTTTDANANGYPDWMDSTTCPSLAEFQCISSASFRDSDADGLIDLYDPDDGGAASATPDLDGINGVDFRDNGTGIILPVSLVNFSGQGFNDAILLQWESATEQALSHYNVLRVSAEGNALSLAQVAAKGDSETSLSYQYRDRFPQSGINVYGLEAVNLDGSLAAIRWISVRHMGSTNLLAGPNPFHDRLMIQASSSQKPRLVDAHGKSWWTAPQAGPGNFVVPTQQWPAGTYWLCPSPHTGVSCSPLVKTPQ